MAHNRWEHFPHDADIGIRGFGPCLAAAFEQAALAMTAAITDPQNVAPSHEVELTCEAPDSELLLVDWLNAIVYEMATRKMLFGRFQVRIEDGLLYGKAWGEPIDVEKHKPIVEVKGATYTELRATCQPNGVWLAQCIIDV
ncbi:MAG: archease [Gammaproteobacteria bacterium]|nr:archease [Gammaproteobacteria bacterium]